MERRSPHALLCVWLGKARKLQDTGGLDENELEILRHKVFGRLSAASKTLTSHFIDARIQLVSAISLSMSEALYFELRSHVASQMANPFVVDD